LISSQLLHVDTTECFFYKIFYLLLAFVSLSYVCHLSSVTLVHPTQANTIEVFGNVSTPFGTLAICWHPGEILRRSSQGNPSVVGENTRGVAEYCDIGHINSIVKGAEV